MRKASTIADARCSLRFACWDSVEGVTTIGSLIKGEVTLLGLREVVETLLLGEGVHRFSR